MSQAASQVLLPMDVVKLGMVIAYVVYQGSLEQDCPLVPWLANLWKMLLGELVLKFLTQSCCSKLTVAKVIISLVLFGETVWNIYGLYLFFTRQEVCKDETELAFKIAIGLYIASNVSAMLLGLFGPAQPAPAAKPHSS